MGALAGGKDDELVASVILNEVGTDPEEFERITAGLRRDLLSLDVRSIRWADGGEPHPGARGLDPVIIGGLLLTLGTSVKLLKDVILALAEWRKAGPSRTVELDIDGATLRLEGGTTVQNADLIEGFLSHVSKD